MGLPAAPLGGPVLVPLSVCVPQLCPTKNEFAAHFFAKVRAEVVFVSPQLRDRHEQWDQNEPA